jgi:hypothetical protein
MSPASPVRRSRLLVTGVALAAVVLLPSAVGGSAAATTRDAGASASAAISAPRGCPQPTSRITCSKARAPGRRFLQTHV